MVSDLLNEKYFHPDKIGDFKAMTPGLIDVSMMSHSTGNSDKVYKGLWLVCYFYSCICWQQKQISPKLDHYVFIEYDSRGSQLQVHTSWHLDVCQWAHFQNATCQYLYTLDAGKIMFLVIILGYNLNIQNRFEQSYEAIKFTLHKKINPLSNLHNILSDFKWIEMLEVNWRTKERLDMGEMCFFRAVIRFRIRI